MPKFYEPEVLKRLQDTELEMLRDFKELCERYGLTWFGIAGTGIGARRHQGFIPWDDDIDLAMPRGSFEKFVKVADTEFGGKYRLLNAWTDSRYPLMTSRWTLRGTSFIEHAMKGAKCPCGIFLDLYVLDPLADGKAACFLQSWEAWFWSKLLILRCMPEPYLFQTGFQARLILAVCRLVHAGLRLLHISPAFLRDRCSAACRRLEGKKTRRMAFLPDTSPYWNVFDVKKTFPLKKLPFEGLEVPFPANLDERLTEQYGDFMTLPPVEKRKTHFPYRLRFGDEKR